MSSPLHLKARGRLRKPSTVDLTGQHLVKGIGNEIEGEVEFKTPPTESADAIASALSVGVVSHLAGPGRSGSTGLAESASCFFKRSES